jgi:hypothetical protein
VPQSLEDLSKSEYANLLVVENPATSSTGLAFLMATVAAYGEDGYLDYWSKLKANGVVIVDVMGSVVESIREENARDLPATTQTATAGGGAARTATVSARDAAIAAAPPIPVMQKKLVKHLKKEVRMIEREVRKLSHSRAQGSAYLLSILYRKIRRLSSLIGEILRASAEVIKRFYVAVFIDRQPLVVRGGTLAPSDE